ncbi:hypothetical protein G9A89_006813 [Geosiphon pyriformis]|nr:hypothetical protein G9A89_006813 [Geosiphon pyriformis]
MLSTPFTLQTIIASSTANSGAAAGTRFGWGNRDNRVIVETVEAWENNVYVGTSDGHLIHYVLEDQINTENSIPKSYLIEKHNLGFGRKFVERILLLPQIQKAVILCDSTLSFYLLPQMEPLPFQYIKGVTCFTYDLAKEGVTEDDGSVKLCVIKKRAVHTYIIREELNELTPSLPLANGGIVACQYGSSLCIADSTYKYRLIDLVQRRMIDIGEYMDSHQPQERNSTPGGGSFKPLTTLGQFVSSKGDPIRGVLRWSSFPRAIGVEYPYVIALLRNNTIEIHNVVNQALIQTIQLSPIEARTISQGPGIKVWVSALLERLRLESCSFYEEDSLESMDVQVLSIDDGNNKENTERGSSRQMATQFPQPDFVATVPTRILIAGHYSILALAPSPLIVQVDALLDANRVEDAINYAEQALSTVVDNIHRERMQHELNYIYQKSGFICLGETLFDVAGGFLERGNIDPRIIIGLFPEMRGLLPENFKPTVYAGVKAIFSRLGNIEDIVFQSLIKNYDPHIKPDVQSSPATQGLRKVLLGNANEMLRSYLTNYRQTRKKLRPAQDLDKIILRAVDNTLVRLYCASDSTELLNSLLLDENQCVLEFCEDILEKYKKYFALSLLYKSKKQYYKTLKIWKEMISSETPEPDFKDGLKKMAELLSTIDDVDLVWEYSNWIIPKDQVLAAQIFIRSDLRQPFFIEPNKVIKELRLAGYVGLTMYLEHIVLQRNSEEVAYHTELALLYINEIELGLMKSNDTAKLDTLKKEFQNSNKTSSLTYLSFLSSRPPDFVSQSRVKFIAFLQLSMRYDVSVVLDKLLKSQYNLEAELALVYGQMHEYEKALHILIDQLGDYRGAETFCLYVGRMIGLVPETSAAAEKRQTAEHKKLLEDKSLVGVRRGLFLELLKVYLEMENRHNSLEKILKLLNKQAVYLDIVEVLALLPETWSIEMLNEFLGRSIRQSFHDYRENQILKGLSRGENIVVNAELYKLYEEIGPVVITTENSCASCQEFINNAEFMRQPNKEIVHINCPKKNKMVGNTEVTVHGAD